LGYKGGKNMDIVKIIGVGLTALVVIIILKQYKPEFVIYVSLAVGAIILLMVMDKLSGIITLLTNITAKTNMNGEFLSILLKITGISILTEYAVSICKDSGEAAIASKVDLGGKIIIISMSIPIITALLELLIKILP
jgi:stage III sporulation protein AD